MQPGNCLNCGKEIDLNNNFCANCGQKTQLHKLSLSELGHEAVHYFTHADKGIFHLLKLLLNKPGTVAREYILGKRKTFFPPLNFFLIVAAICLFMTGVGNRISSRNAGRPTSYTQSAQRQSSAPDMQDIKKQKRAANIGKFMSAYANLIPVFAVPLITVFMWLFYSRAKYNYTEHLIANMYMSGFVLLFYAFLFIPAIAFAGGTRSSGGRMVLLVYFLFEVVYRSFAYYYFINKKGALPFTKAVVVNLGASMGWGIFSQLLITSYIQHGFWGLAD